MHRSKLGSIRSNQFLAILKYRISGNGQSLQEKRFVQNRKDRITLSVATSNSQRRLRSSRFLIR